MTEINWRRIRQYILSGEREHFQWLLDHGLKVNRGAWCLDLTPEIENECNLRGIKLSPMHPNAPLPKPEPPQTWQNTGHFDF